MKGVSFHNPAGQGIAIGFAIAFLLAFCLPQAVRAADNKMRLAIPEIGYPPYIVTTGSTPADTTGILVDVLNSSLPDTGLELEMTFTPERRARRGVRLGRVDAHPTAIEWIENPEDFRWSPGIFEVADSLVMPMPPAEQDPTLASLRGRIIGTMRSYFYPSFESLFTEGHFTRSESATLEGLLKMVAMNRVDAAVIDERTARWTIRLEKLETTQFHFTGQRYDPVLYRLMLSPTRDWSQFNRKLDKSLKKLRDSGEMQAIFRRYR